MTTKATRVGPAGTLGRAFLVAAASMGMAVFRYRAWDRSWSVPFVTAGTDHLYLASLVRSIHDTGWYFTNPHLGAPFGQQLYDFPQSGESAQLLVLRILTLFSDRPFWVMNVYFLLGFATVAFVTFLVLTHLRFSSGVAAVISILYTWLPYHFLHGQFHLFRSAYVTAPLGVLVVFWTLSWKDRFLRDPAGPVWGPRRLVANLQWGRVWGAVALCAFIGAYETMVMAFTLVALVVAAAVSALRNRDVGDLGVAVVGAVVIAATFAVLFAPNLAYKAEHGANSEAAARVPSEQITYGLQLSKVVFPVPTHAIGPLARLMPRSQDESLAPGEAGQNIGLLGVLGLGALLYGVVANRLDTRAGDDPFDRHRLWVQSGLITLVLVLFGTMSGFALVLSTLGLSQIRTWDRVVILIAFCAYLMVAIALERVTAWIRRRLVAGAASRARRANRRSTGAGLAGLLLCGVLVFGLWDTRSSYSSGAWNPVYDRKATEVRRLTDDIAGKLGDEAMLFQLPVVVFPEAHRRARMADYEELRPYLYSDGLRFSYGATRGRDDADWQRRIDSDDPVPALAGLRGLGFDGILLDTTGYTDRGVAVIEALTAALGPPVVVAENRRWYVWDLRGYAAATATTDEALRRAAEDLVGPELLERLSATS